MCSKIAKQNLKKISYIYAVGGLPSRGLQRHVIASERRMYSSERVKNIVADAIREAENAKQIKNEQQREEAQPPEMPIQRSSAVKGLREFLMHPLTWDRNNGFFNILLGLTIFGYCFCSACNTNRPDSVSNEAATKKKK